jgi:hypothetical protein
MFVSVVSEAMDTIHAAALTVRLASKTIGSLTDVAHAWQSWKAKVARKGYPDSGMYAQLFEMVFAAVAPTAAEGTRSSSGPLRHVDIDAIIMILTQEDRD